MSTQMHAIQLLPYEPAFLQRFIAWRKEPLTVRHNPLKQLTESEVEKMLTAESADLAQVCKEIGKAESFRWFIAADGEVVGTMSLKKSASPWDTERLAMALLSHITGRELPQPRCGC